MSTTTKLTLKDQSWDCDLDALTIKDLFLIKNASGLNLKDFLQGLQNVDPLAYQTLVWFVRMKAGEMINLSSVDFVITDLDIVQVTDAVPLDEPETTTVSSETAI